MKRVEALFFFLMTAIFVLPSGSAVADISTLTIEGSDAIFLAGRSDVIVPPPSQPWDTGTHLLRHSSSTPEEIQETHPPFVDVMSGDIVRFAAPANGGISFYNGFGSPFLGPTGDETIISNLTSLDGISGYQGPGGPLIGVFLSNSIPDSGPAPDTLSFHPWGLGTDFSTLSPQLSQVFYIGDGITSSGELQTFVAPSGATRLFLGIPDGSSFNGAPGFYDDNDGSYQVNIGINGIPPIPEPGPLALWIVGLLALGFIRWLAIRRETLRFGYS